MAKRILALVMALTLVFALAACKKNDKPENTTNDATEIVTNDEGKEVAVPADETTEVETNDEGETATEANVTEADTKENGKPVNNVKPNSNSTKPAAKDPSTKAEIVALFNSAANAVKADKPGYTKSEKNVIDTITCSNKGIDKLIKKIVPMFPTDGGTVTVAKGASHNDFPVKGGKANLSPAAVKSATCTKSGNSYNVTIYMADEKLPDLPANPRSTKHGQAFNVLSADEVYSQTKKFSFIAKVNAFAPTYTGSYIKCTINADGKMTKAEYLFYTKANLKVRAFGDDMLVHVPFGVKQNYTIKY